MAKYKAYPEYKDSGVEWLGEIPRRWIRSKFGYLKTILTDYTANGSFADLKSNVTYLDEPSYARLVRLTDLRHGLNNSNGVWIDKNSYNYLGKSSLYGGEFLLANVGAYAGLFYQMPYNKGPASLAPNMFMAKFSPEKISRKFIAYVGQADNISKQLMLKATASSAQPKLNKDDFKSIFCCYPPLNEQTKISLFLDHETAKIDNLIEKQQQLIELLKEKRQAVISHAVTKGLNPDVPMKDSGVEWLGKVPENWNVIKLKYLINVFEQGWSPQCEARLAEGNEYGVLKVGCVNTGDFNPLEHKALPSNLEPQMQYLVKKDDLLISRANTKELVGSSAVVEKDYDNLILCDKLYRLRFEDPVNPYFISEFIRTPMVRKQIELSASGASHSMQNIGQDTIKELFVALPPEDETQQLIAFIKNETSVFDSLMNLSNRQVALLQERRTALISAAVTGKIDVRDWVAPDKQDIEKSQEATA